MIEFFDILSNFFYYGLLVYSFTLISCYLVLGIMSIRESALYMRRQSFVDYKAISNSPISPSISIIAPAYNEGRTITENVKSLLSIRYSNYEVIVVNDGSKDDSMQKLIQAYALEKFPYAYEEQLNTEQVRAVYRSRNPIYSKLLVVDKENGGKSDALNAGLNISRNKYVACVDVDCILEQDSLLKMVKPFLDDGEGRVIATGGVVRIANSCVVQDGRLVKVNLPKKLLPRVQTLEYIRAFLLGRMAWSKMNGLLLISGAFGLFDKRICIDCGGYNTATVGEDMELVVRMRRYMHAMKQPYKVIYIPDPLCWTEAPDTYKILARQRNRWTRGTAETLWLHKKLFFNPSHGFLGMISYPYWFLFEWLAPIVEFFGILYFFFLALLGYVNWPFFLALLAMVYSFAIMFSIFALVSEELTYHQYKKKSDIFKLILTGMLEPVLFHPWSVWNAILGNVDLLTGRKSWGEMTRKGFHRKEPTKVVTPV
ncbi:MAG: glycosyltransferase [Bacteroidia bacterium]|nr:glycosyltransferase [Bacteroidia bacterium]